MENPMSEFAKKLQACLHAGCNFASVKYETVVTTSAKFKALNVTKVTVANVQLFADVACNPYARAVERSVEKLSGEAVDFTVATNWFTHSSICYSIVEHATKGAYLYVLFNSSKSNYYIDGVLSSKDEVLELLTPSARKAATSKTVYNSSNNIVHDVTVRTIKLENVRHIKVGGQTLTP